MRFRGQRLGLVIAVLSLCLNSCQLHNSLPLIDSDGSHAKLPDSATRVIVWGGHPEAVRSVTIWLQKQGYVVVDDLKIKQVAQDHHSAVPLSNVDVVNLAVRAGAKEVIFVDADIATWNFPEILAFLGHSPNAYKATLFIRALDVETGEIDWTGKALSVDKFADLGKGIHHLTCNALATGWGFQKPGVNAKGSVCPHGQNVMVLNETPSLSKKEVVRSSVELDSHH